MTNWARSYGRGLSTTAGSAAIPYGYTLTVWGTGTLLATHHPERSLLHVILFVFGAAVGYGIVRVASSSSRSRGARGITRHSAIRGGAIHGSAIAAALALADALGRLPSLWAWFLAPLAATTTYLGVTALEEMFTLVGDEEREEGTA